MHLQVTATLRVDKVKELEHISSPLLWPQQQQLMGVLLMLERWSFRWILNQSQLIKVKLFLYFTIILIQIKLFQKFI
ncbi:Uncharacterised protein [Mycobacterium tuberculosis]|nr:Uncharacterised protein [Mycobacterium tuberculosis]